MEVAIPFGHWTYAKLKRLKLKTKDTLRNSSSIQTLVGLAQLALSLIAWGRRRRLTIRSEAFRILAGVKRHRWAAPVLARWVSNPARSHVWRDLNIGAEQYKVRPLVNKGMVLKAPRGDERGVILTSFEYNVLNLLACRNPAEVLRKYTLLVVPSWFPPAYSVLWHLAGFPESDIYVSKTNPGHDDVMPTVAPGFKFLPIAACDFVNPEGYEPLPKAQRDIDILMIANWAPFKRHWRLFDAMTKMPPDLKVVLAGQPQSGRTVDHVRDEARLFGVADRVTFYDCLPFEKVVALQCRSKVSLLLSKREGSSKINTEAMFANTPIGVLRGAQIASAAYVNKDTGMLLEDANLAEDLMVLLESQAQKHPRPWAIEHVSNRASLHKLNQLLRADAEAAGRPWTQDCCNIHWMPTPCHASPTDLARLAPAYVQLRDEHGLQFRHLPQAGEGSISSTACVAES